MERRVTISNTEYRIIDQLCNVTIPDSFTRIKTGGGHGEAKLYVGQEKSSLEFWEDNIHCFFIKDDLEAYLRDAESEYKDPRHAYDPKFDTKELWIENINRVDGLTGNVIGFDIMRSKVAPPRYYVNSQRDGKEVWTLFRSIMLPVISHMTIFKLQNTATNEIVFYFKPYMDNSYNAINHDSIITAEERKIVQSGLDRTTRESLFQARIGQGIFRQKLLKEIKNCIITKIDERKVLVASHIKPWSKASNEERLDHYNGLILSATYDKLFDQGFISFKQDGGLKISNHLSSRNIERLGLLLDQPYDIPHLDERESYLEYHRSTVFQK